MKDLKFLTTAFMVEKKDQGGNGIIPYMNLEMSTPTDKVDSWGTTEMEEEPRELRLVTRTKFFELQRFQVKANYHPELAKDINFYHGVDADKMFYSTLNDDMDQNILKNLYSKYNDLGEITRASEYTKWQKIILKWFNKVVITNYALENKEGSELIYNKIVVEANKIASKTRIKPGDFVVCSSLIGSLLQDHPGFSAEPIDTQITLSPHSPISHIGKIAGRIDVYINANLKFSNGYVIVGRKTNANESGVYFIYDQRERFEIAAANTMETKIGISQRIAVVDTNGAEKSFSKMHFTIGKKPFWKKLFNI